MFVLDMGEPVKILDLAKSMVRLSGRALHEETGRDGDIEIVVEGLRPGEKMYEELFIDADSHRRTEVSKIFTADEAWLPWNELEPRLAALRELARGEDAAALRGELRALAGAGRRRARAPAVDPGTDPDPEGPVGSGPSEPAFGAVSMDETVAAVEWPVAPIRSEKPRARPAAAAVS